MDGLLRSMRTHFVVFLRFKTKQRSLPSLSWMSHLGRLLQEPEVMWDGVSPKPSWISKHNRRRREASYCDSRTDLSLPHASSSPTTPDWMVLSRKFYSSWSLKLFRQHVPLLTPPPSPSASRQCPFLILSPRCSLLLDRWQPPSLLLNKHMLPLLVFHCPCIWLWASIFCCFLHSSCLPESVAVACFLSLHRLLPPPFPLAPLTHCTHSLKGAFFLPLLLMAVPLSLSRALPHWQELVDFKQGCCFFFFLNPPSALCLHVSQLLSLIWSCPSLASNATINASI